MKPHLSVAVAVGAGFLCVSGPAQSWTDAPAPGRPALAVMGDPGRGSFTNGTPAVLRDQGYRVRVIWSPPNGDETVRRLFPVLVVERQHFTQAQYERLRAYVRGGGGLVLIGYAANWLDGDGNQRRDGTDTEIRGAHGSGGLTELVGAARVGETSMIQELQPVAGDPLCVGLETYSWDKPAMGEGCNVVTLNPTNATVACRMVQRQFDWSEGLGELDPAPRELVVHRSVGSGRVVWIGWTGIFTATRKGNASARQLLRNCIAWCAGGNDLNARADDKPTIDARIWQPESGRFTRGFDPNTPAGANNVETMLCHFTGRWHTVFGPPAEFAQWLAERHVEIVRVNVAACSRVFYAGSNVPSVHEWPASRDYRAETGRDMLADLVTELHARNIQLCGDYNHFSDRYRPDGDLGLPRAVDREGNPGDRTYCWLSPEFARRTRDLTEEMFSRYALDRLVIEDDRMPLCFCESCLAGFRAFCKEHGVPYVDPRKLVPKRDVAPWRLFARFRAETYYERVVSPMREMIHARRPGAKLGCWVGHWMRESHNGYSRIGMAPYVDFQWHMAYVDPGGVASDVCSDLANVARFGTEQGAAMRPKGEAAYTIHGLTAALESGARVIGVYPEFIKTAADPGYEGMAQVFGRAEALWADRYERRLASFGSVLMLCAEMELPVASWRVRFAEAGLDLRAARLYDDGRRISDLASELAGTQVVLATHDLLLTDADLEELERFVRGGGGLYFVPQAFRGNPEFFGGDIVARSAVRENVAAWLRRFGMQTGTGTDVSWMSLRSDHGASAGTSASLPVFSSCVRVTPARPSVVPVGRAADSKATVFCAGELGKGRIACFGGVGDGDWSAVLLPHLCRWLARADGLRVTGRHVEGRRATVSFENSGGRAFAGLLGIAVPTAVGNARMTVGGTPAAIVRQTTWGSLRYLYASVGVASGASIEIAVIADRDLVAY